MVGFLYSLLQSKTLQSKTKNLKQSINQSPSFPFLGVRPPITFLSPDNGGTEGGVKTIEREGAYKTSGPPRLLYPEGPLYGWETYYFFL